jgi:hypothetical protein
MPQNPKFSSESTNTFLTITLHLNTLNFNIRAKNQHRSVLRNTTTLRTPASALTQITYRVENNLPEATHNGNRATTPAQNDNIEEILTTSSLHLKPVPQPSDHGIQLTPPQREKSLQATEPIHYESSNLARVEDGGYLRGGLWGRSSARRELLQRRPSLRAGRA